MPRKKYMFLFLLPLYHHVQFLEKSIDLFVLQFLKLYEVCAHSLSQCKHKCINLSRKD